MPIVEVNGNISSFRSCHIQQELNDQVIVKEMSNVSKKVQCKVQKLFIIKTFSDGNMKEFLH